MKKLLINLGLFVLAVIIVAVFVKFYYAQDTWICDDGQWTKRGNPEQGPPATDCGNVGSLDQAETTDIIYTDVTGKWSLTFPEDWAGRYIVRADNQGDKITTYFNYIDNEGEQATVFMIHDTTGEDVGAIYHEPNNELLAMTKDHKYSVSQALDIPYQEESEDFVQYGQMATEINDVIDTFIIKQDNYLELSEIRESNHRQNYNINVLEAKVINKEDMKVINDKISSTLNDLIVYFRELAEESYAVDRFSEQYSSLWAGPEIVQLNNDLISLYYLVSEYSAGAAHPNNYSLGLNYDVSTGEEITLEDVFSVPETQYLPVVAEYVLADLKEQFIEREMDPENSMLIDGTVADPLNYGNFNLNKEGIRFNFDPYAVAPYAAGNFHVTIPYNEINDMLNNKFTN